MDGVLRHLAHLFCCIPLRRKNKENEQKYMGTWQQPASSTLSIPLPHTAVPHGSSESNTDDARALHHIFSSSSSIRGYQTAATTPGYQPTTRPSFDRTFQFGPQSQSPQKQPPGRIEKLGEHIRQRLSESRLSKASSHQDDGKADVGLKSIKSPTVAQDVPVLAVSHSSTGLTELLASRNASQGGYDSDAQTIKTPLVRSNAGTLNARPGLVKRPLDKIDQSEYPNDPAAQSCANQSVSTLEHHALTSHEKAKSSPFPSTPSRTSFSTALQPGVNESPSDALKRLSIGLANGTVKMPDTPELRALRMPSITEVDSIWRQATTERHSSLKVSNDEMQKKLKRLSDKVDSLKRNSVEGVDKRASLISELDPALIDYMTMYAERVSSDEVQETEAPQEEVTAIRIEEGEPETQLPSPAPNSPEQTTQAEQSQTERDSDSVHLFNMRISQRLASLSRIPMISPVPSHNASTCSLAIRDHNAALRPQTSGGAPYHKFIASEHNRRPSDPQTRRLFEGEGAGAGCRLPNSTWLSVSSIPTSGDTTMRPHQIRDDASSFYFSDNGDRSVAVSPTSTRRNSLMNPNSLAVGGRSVSANLPGRQSNQSAGQLSTAAAESVWLGQKPPQRNRSSEDSWLVPGQATTRGRSVSMPQKQETSQEIRPTPFSKKQREPTKSAEGMSEISLERVVDRRNEGITEITQQALDERRNENFSEVEYSLHVPKMKHDALTANDCFININSSPNRGVTRQGSIAANNTLGAPPVGIQECATSVWGRAFRNAQDQKLGTFAGNFLTAPRFDREGRRRSTTGSISDGSVARRRSERSVAPDEHRRSQSEEPARRPSAAVDLDLHQRLCSAAKTPLPGAGSGTAATNQIDKKMRSQTMKEGSKPRKKSILDLGRRFTTSGPSADAGRANGASTPIRELLGVWSRFPSHTREERNGAATLRDGVKSHDFQPDSLPNILSPAHTTPTTTSAAPMAFKMLSRGVHKRLNRAKSKSMPFRTKSNFVFTPAERARRSRKGIIGRWRKLYRSSSGELRKHAMARGHRSSFSLGDAPEYPELECLPGEGMFNETDMQRWRSEVDGGVDTPFDQWDSISTKKVMPGSNKPEAGVPAASKPRRIGASYWADYYASCVGSLSALKSDADMADIMSMSMDDGLGGVERDVSKQRDEMDEKRDSVLKNATDDHVRPMNEASRKSKEVEVAA